MEKLQKFDKIKDKLLTNAVGCYRALPLEKKLVGANGLRVKVSANVKRKVAFWGRKKECNWLRFRCKFESGMVELWLPSCHR